MSAISSATRSVLYVNGYSVPADIGKVTLGAKRTRVDQANGRASLVFPMDARGRVHVELSQQGTSWKCQMRQRGRTRTPCAIRRYSMCGGDLATHDIVVLAGSATGRTRIARHLLTPGTYQIEAGGATFNLVLAEHPQQSPR